MRRRTVLARDDLPIAVRIHRVPLAPEPDGLLEPRVAGQGVIARRCRVRVCRRVRVLRLPDSAYHVAAASCHGAQVVGSVAVIFWS